MISKRITVPLLCLLPLLAIMALMDALHAPTTNAAPNGTQTVTTLANSGAGSLRQTIADATAGDTIEFSINGTIVLATQIIIDKDLTINGGEVITVSGNTTTRVFNITSGNVTLDSLTITNGNGQGVGCPFTFCGGGIIIQNSGLVVTITNSILANNTADYGGGIYNLGTVFIISSTISENSGGGGIYNYNGTTTIISSNISDNSGYTGGGVKNHLGAVIISNCTISNNSASYGGGIHMGGGNTTITNSTIINNSAYVGVGGGIANEGGSMTLNNSSVLNNQSADHGAGLYNYATTLIINNSTFYGNSGTWVGGGISNFGTIIVNNSNISGNSAMNAGGIYNEDGIATISNSTISSNSAYYKGGGIYNNMDGSMEISNSTITDNYVGMMGGGINSSGNEVTQITITNTIISGNIISSTMMPDDLTLLNGYTDNFNSGGHNLIGTIGAGIVAFVDGVNGDQVGVNNPKLFSLANNGGATLTHALQFNSPAVDAGANCGATDQRGITRPQGAACDIGAYELVPVNFTDFIFLPVVVK